MKKDFNIILILLSIVVVVLTAISIKKFFLIDDSSGTYEGYVIEKQGMRIIARETLLEEEKSTEIHFMFSNENIIQDIKVGQKVSITHGDIVSTEPTTAHGDTITIIE
ncbi:hypothetical protein [Priestia taiwanensis]|uniref:DUF3221 domain-containing protein n=1 Tax=Priestia taiwanensis TaxID=1347902 RepID=A0A917ARL4_9BACI|nr:hypothetical protein [Priestia taiwanensis]MBM7363288.1 hypothetical protein [Priestia taiwanensis]GGE69187.1 hypothetical protein GCM10007140_19070 [Priestia taiwanensis]